MRLFKKVKQAEPLKLTEEPPHLDVVLGCEANKHEQEDRHDVVRERNPVGNLERRHHSTDQHEKDGARSQDGAHHQHALVDNVREGDVVVDGNGALVVTKQIHDVGHCGRGPPTTLCVELAEAFRAVSVGIGGSTVLNTVASLQEQGA